MYALKTFTVATIVFVFAAAVSAEPVSRTVYRCGTPENPSCPSGYRCCGPFIVDPPLGGTCVFVTFFSRKPPNISLLSDAISE
ncbi:hypothetical protein GYMLUDRAFT_252361 [Collybiopsis luxurians FD-317 M1]|uniref:Hydrophobin n=1 Tax=Collybiopsis luxurians FD-317 M1 TaxID=944289 RepID=A0A0D0BA32_9AGAR|nr:hypothetical protein GYMLUDRAFT_252361 [Collybiopsis luxurians FD-317 M1]